MPRRALDPFWVGKIRVIVVNEPSRTLKSITDQLEAEGKELGRKDYPSDRTIRRYRDEIRAAPEEEQRAYRFVYWPESFERGDLPWEAAPVVLELLRDWRDRYFSEPGPHVEPPPRPEVRHAVWFWRVTLAAPSRSLGDRSTFAFMLAMAFAGPEQEQYRHRRSVELTLLTREGEKGIDVSDKECDLAGLPPKPNGRDVVFAMTTLFPPTTIRRDKPIETREGDEL